MIRDNYLDVNKLVGNKKIFKLFRVVEQHGGVLRFVGGAVRDALKGLSDLTSIWQPICLPMSWWKLAPKKG